MLPYGNNTLDIIIEIANCEKPELLYRSRRICFFDLICLQWKGAYISRPTFNAETSLAPTYRCRIRFENNKSDTFSASPRVET